MFDLGFEELVDPLPTNRELDEAADANEVDQTITSAQQPNTLTEHADDSTPITSAPTTSTSAPTTSAPTSSTSAATTSTSAPTTAAPTTSLGPRSQILASSRLKNMVESMMRDIHREQAAIQVGLGDITNVLPHQNTNNNDLTNNNNDDNNSNKSRGRKRLPRDENGNIIRAAPSQQPTNNKRRKT